MAKGFVTFGILRFLKFLTLDPNRYHVYGREAVHMQMRTKPNHLIPRSLRRDTVESIQDLMDEIILTSIDDEDQ